MYIPVRAEHDFAPSIENLSGRGKGPYLLHLLLVARGLLGIVKIAGKKARAIYFSKTRFPAYIVMHRMT
jgi:hypothetical protein